LTRQEKQCWTNFNKI